ncbi:MULTISPECIES: copper chaperone PCu(A)C [unclassified Brevibacterium]|uniref:copper chaperone PCu(A)C n=1 Tax=unclassified Brevibacterium TaxID=2614124 RepID=UPI001091CBDF|nr:copper chaperone PCu(A)C [Brevibacterium sp. S22]TGD31641.1 copper chaperone PCu(A)C [Brevibacterium sp. S22]
MRKNITLALALPIAVTIGLAGCGQDDSKAAGSAQTEGDSSASADSSESRVDAEALSLEGAWVKAADDGMTAVFGELHNNTDHDINLVEAKYADAKMVELHETEGDGSGGMSMQEKEGGFTIPAGESLHFEPGGDHIMIMGLEKAIKPGEKISLDLVTADDETVEVTAVAKEYSGAQEDYAPGEAEGSSDDHAEHDDHGEHEDHEDSDHGDHGDH